MLELNAGIGISEVLATLKEELREAGITYVPMVWTSNGRPHPAATRVMRHLASLASHSSEQDANAKSMLKRWGHETQVAIQRRKAAMARAALPKLKQKMIGS